MSRECIAERGPDICLIDAINAVTVATGDRKLVATGRWTASSGNGPNAVVIVVPVVLGGWQGVLPACWAQAIAHHAHTAVQQACMQPGRVRCLSPQHAVLLMMIAAACSTAW